MLNVSINERATDLIRNGRIKLYQLATFMYEGTSEPRCIKLFRMTTSSSPAVGHCYHIVAASQAVGLVDVPLQHMVNPTQLHKNTRKRPDKTCCRKHLHLSDVDVEPSYDMQPYDCKRVANLIAPGVYVTCGGC